MALDIDYMAQNEKLQKVHAILQDRNRQFIVIDGLISAGKTTLIKLIENFYSNRNNNQNNQLKVKAIFEPVDLWNSTGALKYFYDDIKANCYEFQTYTYITRVNSVIDEIYNNPDANIYILERSIWTDRYIFMELLRDHVGELRMKMYNQWCDLWAYILPMRVDKWVFLDTSVEESIKRIKIRNRNAETNIDVDYQRKLYDKHIDFYNRLVNSNYPVIKIESELMNGDFINNKNILEEIIIKIIQSN